MKQWLLKLIGGWIPVGTKPFPEWAGKVIWAVGICVAVNLVIGFFSPRPTITTVGQGGTQIINQAEKQTGLSFGCALWKGYIKAGIK